MKVLIDGVAGSVALTEADDLQGLAVELRSCPPHQAATLLAGLGHLEEAHAWLSIEGLRQLSPLTGSGDWDSRFDGAMAYARSKGWTDPAGERVRAHLETGEP